MKILLSNDDGYLAPGLACLASELKSVYDITVIAPDRNRSGASNSLSLKNPLRIYQAENGFYYVEGTPADCVHLAITGFLDPRPQMVIAGINNGANLGDDVLYSGTVAAAMEGRSLGLPALAVSLVGRQVSHYQTAAKAVTQLLKRMDQFALSGDMILNINVPDLPFEEIKGYQITRLGRRHQAEPMIKSATPSGEEIYWVGPAGEGCDAGDGTDFHAVANGYVSITPLKIDLTDYNAVDFLKEWIVMEKQNG